MEPVRRVVIRDKYPIFGPEILARPLNRFVLAGALVSVGVQAAALAQVIGGHGRSVSWPEHAGFAVVAFLWLAMGVLVFLQRRAYRAGQLFLLSASAGAVFLSMGTLYGTGQADALAFAGGLMLCAALLISFTRACVETRPWDRRETLLLVPVAALVIPGAADLAAGRTGIAWKLCLLLVAGLLMAAIAQSLLDLLAASTPAAAAQSRALLVGLITGTSVGIALYVWPLVTTGSLLVQTGLLPVIILLFLAAMSYAILLFEFSEADLIVRRGVVYGSITLLMLAVYGGLGVLLDISRASVTGVVGGIGFVAASVAIGVAFLPLRRGGRRFADWLFYGSGADRWETLQALSARLGSVMQPEDLSRTLVSDLSHALHLRGAFLFGRDADGGFSLWAEQRNVARDSVPASSRNEERVEGRQTDAPLGDMVVGQGGDGAPSPSRERSPALRDHLAAEAVGAALGSPLRPLLLVHAKPLTFGRRKKVPARFLALDALHSALTIPLVTRSGLEAILCLQPKLAHDAFRSDDLELLAPVVRQASVALENALLFARLEEKIEELRQAYMRIAHEQETERARLARELHDGTAQELAGLITLATVAGRQLETASPAAESVRSTLDRLKLRAEEAYQDVRRASHALRPPVLDDFGLSAALSRYLDEYQETTGIAVDRSIGEVGTLGPDAELALFRVAQECLENVRKHSRAYRVQLALSLSNGKVELLVHDLGDGARPAPDGARRDPAGPGIGLAGMRERVEAVGGQLTLSYHHGFEVRAVVPAGMGGMEGMKPNGDGS
jgi:signal transduction histidine kinase